MLHAMHARWRGCWRAPRGRRWSARRLRLDGGCRVGGQVAALDRGPGLLGLAGGGAGSAGGAGGASRALGLQVGSDAPEGLGVVDLGKDRRQRLVPQALRAPVPLEALGPDAALTERPHDGHGDHRLCRLCRLSVPTKRMQRERPRCASECEPRYGGGRGGWASLGATGRLGAGATGRRAAACGSGRPSAGGAGPEAGPEVKASAGRPAHDPRPTTPARLSPTRPRGSGLVGALGPVAACGGDGVGGAPSRRWGSHSIAVRVRVPGKGHVPRCGLGWAGRCAVEAGVGCTLHRGIGRRSRARHVTDASDASVNRQRAEDCHGRLPRAKREGN